MVKINKLSLFFLKLYLIVWPFEIFLPRIEPLAITTIIKTLVAIFLVAEIIITKKIKALKFKQFYFFGFMFLVIIIQKFLPGVVSDTARIIDWYLLSAFLMFAVVFCIYNDKTQFKKLFLLICVSTFIKLSINFLMGMAAGGLHGGHPWGDFHVNELGAYIVTFLALFVGLAETSKTTLKKLINLFLVITMVYMILRTGSKGAFVGLIIIALMIIWNYKKYISFYIFGILLIIIVFSITPSAMTKRVFTIFDPELDIHQKTTGRWEAWKIGLRVFKDYPLFGVGWEKSNQFIARNQDIYAPEGCVRPGLYYPGCYVNIHSIEIRFLTETGILGFICFLGIVIYSFKDIRYIIKNSKKNTYEYFIGRNLAIASVGYIIPASFGQTPGFWRYFVIIGLIISLRMIVENEKNIISDRQP